MDSRVRGNDSGTQPSIIPSCHPPSFRAEWSEDPESTAIRQIQSPLLRDSVRSLIEWHAPQAFGVTRLTGLDPGVRRDDGRCLAHEANLPSL